MTTSPPPLIPRPRSPERGTRTPWRSLRHRAMRWWSAANLVSNVGTWMQLTVQNLLVLHITGSAATTGLSLSVQAAPGLLMGLLGGAAVDAWPRKLTAAVSQAVLGLVAFVTAALVAFDLLNVVSLMVLAAVTGLVATVDAPACALLGNDLVPPDDVPSAIALGSVVSSAGRLIGVACAGVAVGTLGTAAAYAANGLSFLCVAAVIPFLRPHPGAATAADPPTARRDRLSGAGARDGLAFFVKRPRLVALTVITAVSAVFGRNYGLTLAVLVTGPLAGSSEDFGTVATVLAVGGIAGAVLAGRMQRPSVRMVGALAAAGALLQAVAGLSPGLIPLLVLVAPMAVAESVSDTAGTTVLQTDPPPGMRGRVLGVWRTAQTAWGLAGPPLLGLLMEWAGPRGALVAGGLIIAAVIGAGALVHVRRTASRRVPATVVPVEPAAAERAAAPVPHEDLSPIG
ncbi:MULTISPECIES: MFS transporter [unclassified Streptomyces]|uniref:MFS transporter n=1 Tax=unclassified Streptomyces TaxID=2593676 RepID=UPI00168AADA1|nr:MULTISPECIES: MFS transporter [unclassified Streptomyces]MBD3009432.1 MFS transporter [Streptomyces sp. 5-10]